MNMHSNTHAKWKDKSLGSVLPQSGLLVYPPLAFNSYQHVKIDLFTRLCIWQKSPSWCSSCWWIWPPSQAKPPEQGLFFL